jgi:hypothetical protein
LLQGLKSRKYGLDPTSSHVGFIPQAQAFGTEAVALAAKRRIFLSQTMAQLN